MKKKYILTLIALCMSACALGATACKDRGSSDSDSLSQSESSVGEEVTVPSLQFTDGKVEMLLGETKQLSVGNLEAGETVVTYTSNDENVVTVSESGLIEGKGVGLAVVKATSSTGRSGLIQITVYDPESYPIPYLSLDYSAISLFVGDDFALSYTYSYLGKTYDATVEMTSDNTSVAVVENGAIRAVGVGEANVLVKATSSYGEAARTVKVTVLENQIEFYPSFFAKDIYVGNPMDLAMYINDQGTVKTIDGATFTVADPDFATIENGQLVPLLGGDTTITCSFTYDGETYEETLPIHIYGLHTCSFTLIDGTVNSSVEALYGDVISLKLENEDNNPEYNKAIKCWYVNGELVTDDYFVMPDEDVEVSVRFINETADNFEKSYSNGYLVNNVQAKVQHVDEVFTDEQGNRSADEGYMKISSTAFGTAAYNFEEVVTINEFGSIRIRLYVTEESPLLYFGILNPTLWPDTPQEVAEGEEGYEEYLAAMEVYNAVCAEKAKDKKYEASACGHASGDVPVAVLPNREWTILEMPLTAFGKVGEKLNGITMSVASVWNEGEYQCGGDFLVDFISVNYGLAGTDVGYIETTYFNAIFAEEAGGDAQAEAISRYYQWSLTLSEEDRNSDEHQAHVAEIRELINTAYVQNKKFTNDPTLVGGADCGNSIDHQASVMGKPENYKSYTYERIHVMQLNAAPHDGTISLARMNYDAYTEAYFGMFAVVAAVNDNPATPGTAKIAIGDQSFTFTSTSGGHYFKVWIKDGVLTFFDDSKDEKDGGGVLFTYTLPEAVVSGNEPLQIKGECDAWSAIEITEMYATTLPRINAILNATPSNWTVAGTRLNGFTTEYVTVTQKTFGSDEFDGSVTLDEVNYNAYGEVYFGLHAIAGARNWEPYDGDNGIITICGESFEVDPRGGDYFFKVTIKDGILTMAVESVGKPGAISTSLDSLTVELPEDVLNGTTGLVIDFNFGAWSQAEISSMHIAITPLDII